MELQHTHKNFPRLGNNTRILYKALYSCVDPARTRKQFFAIFNPTYYGISSVHKFCEFADMNIGRLLLFCFGSSAPITIGTCLRLLYKMRLICEIAVRDKSGWGKMYFVDVCSLDCGWGLSVWVGVVLSCIILFDYRCCWIC